MGGEDVLSTGESPDMKITDGVNTLNFHDVFLDLVTVDTLWLLLHKDVHAIFKNWDGRVHDKDREKICADWICNLSLREIEDDDGSYNDTN